MEQQNQNKSEEPTVSDANEATDKNDGVLKGQNNYKSNYGLNGNTINSKFTLLGDLYEDSKNQLDITEKIDNYIHDFKPSKNVILLGNEEKVNFCTDLLKKERILLVDCFDYDVMLGTTAAIVGQEKFISMEKKRMNFDKGDKTRADIIFQTVIDEYILIKKNILLTIFINEQKGSLHFFNHLLSHDFKTGLGDYQRVLYDQDCYIIIAVAELENIKALTANESKWKKLRASIPYLHTKLLEIFKEDEAMNIYLKINKQREKGKWSKREEDFFKEILRCFDEHPNDFKRIVEEVDMTESTSSFENMVVKDNERAKSLVGEDDKLIRYISFIAVFFEKLSLNEFQFVAQSLLNDKNKSEIISNPLKPEEMVERLLLERWNDTVDIQLRKIYLKDSFSSQYDGRVIDFETQGFREIFKERFLNTWNWFYQQQFNYLFFNQGLLLKSDTPFKVLENLIRISVEIATNDPDIYCQKLLFYTTFSVINQYAKIDVKIDPEEEDFEDVFENFLRQLEEKHFELEIQKYKAFKKIGLLIAEMYKHDNLRSRVTDFFNLLIEYSFHNVVFFFVKYLRKITDFDTLYWIKQLLDRAPIRIKKETYLFFVKILFENTPDNVFNLFKEIKEWHNGKIKIVSDSDNAGLCVLMDYLFTSVEKLSYDDYGKYPLKLHLFSLIENIQQGTEIVDFLIEWLLNPHLKDSFNTIESFFEKNNEPDFYEETLAHLIILLKAVFTGVNKMELGDSKNNISIQLGEVMIESIKRRSNKLQMKELKVGFKNWRDSYDQRKRDENTNSRKYRDLFFLLSKTSGSLLNYFNT